MMQSAYVGILLNTPVYERMLKGKSTGHEIMSFYEEGAAAFGLTPVFLQLSSLKNAQPHGKTVGLVRAKGRYVKTAVDTPALVHNRAIHLDGRSRRRLESLARLGINIYNLHTRYDKLTLQRLLIRDPVVSPHLPDTEPATPAAVRQMMLRYPALIIKPANGSVGQGIMQLKQQEEGGAWSWKYRLKGKSGWRTVRFREELPTLLKQRLRQRKYIVQQFLPLARYDGKPFDIRVSVQRDESGDWQITGMAGKVARKGAFLTNVAQGGQVLPLDTLLAGFPQWDPVDLKYRLGELSLHIARFMSDNLAGLADLGFDMGIMEDGHLIFIESNGRDQRYSFGESGMDDAWRATYRNPMGYASYLSQVGKSP